MGKRGRGKGDRFIYWLIVRFWPLAVDRKRPCWPLLASAIRNSSTLIVAL